MKRYFSLATQSMLPVLLVCILLAMLGRTSTIVPAATPAFAGSQGVPASPYHNVIVVAKSGGDFPTVQKALNSINDNSPNNRYLVWVAPGIYTESVTLKNYVDIEGAGEQVTKITNTGGQSPNIGTLTGYVTNVEVRNLTAENTGGNNYATAIYVYGAAPSFLHVTATASGANTSNNAFYLSTNAAPTLRNITAIASGGWTNYGVNNTAASPTLIDTLVSGSGGGYRNYAMYNFQSSPTIRNSKLSATGTSPNYTIENYAYYGSYSLIIDNSTLTGSTNTMRSHPLYVVRVGASKLDGGPVETNGGTVTCAGVYDENYVFFPNTCP